MSALPTVSVVIPTLNAAGTLLTTLAPLRGGPGEIVIADGGSSDDTCDIARVAGATVVNSQRGRGQQLQAGAEASKGDWLLFLHADTRPSDSWRAEIAGYINDPASRERAAAFRFALDDPSPQARRMERLVNWRSRALGLPYGDQGLFLPRRVYDEAGGYDDIPLMEDVDLDNFLPPMTPYSIMKLGRVKLLPFFLPGDAAMGEAVRGLAGKRSAVMLANHGPVVAGKDVEAACNAIEELEDTARLAMMTRGMNPRMLTPGQVRELVNGFDVEWDE